MDFQAPFATVPVSVPVSVHLTDLYCCQSPQAHYLAQGPISGVMNRPVDLPSLGKGMLLGQRL